MVQIITYSKEKGTWQTAKEQKDIEVPKIIIPSDVLSHLDSIASIVAKKFDEKLKTFRKRLEARILEARIPETGRNEGWYETRPFEKGFRAQPSTELSLEDEGKLYKKFRDGKVVEAINPCVAIPEFRISLRGRRRKNTYEIDDVYLIDSETRHDFAYGSFALVNRGYDTASPMPEVIKGHFHPPLKGKDQSFKHLLSVGDLALDSEAIYGNIGLKEMEFLLSLEPDNGISQKIFLRLANNTIADVPYQISSAIGIKGYDASVRIIEHSHERLGYPFRSYNTKVKFTRKSSPPAHEIS